MTQDDGKERKLMDEVIRESGGPRSEVRRLQKCTECGAVFEPNDGRVRRCPTCRDKEKVIKEAAEKTQTQTKLPETPPEEKVSNDRPLKPIETNWQYLCERQSEEINKLIAEVDTLTKENKRLKGGMGCLIEALNHLYGRNCNESYTN